MSSEEKNATFRRSSRVKAHSVTDKRAARPARVPDCTARLDTSTWTMICERARRTRDARPALGLMQCSVSGGSEFSDPEWVDFHEFQVCAS